MRFLKAFPYLLIFFLFLQACKEDPVSRDNANLEFENLLSDLETNLQPISSTDPNSSTNDLTSLNSIADAKVIGLGEATHGTKEFFQMKDKIFRYLVENHNVRIFAFEADMGESLFIDRYIQGEPGDIEEIMRTRMHFWTWRNEEVRGLLKWMRDYNEGKSESEKIHYIGIDTQYMTYQPQLIENYIQRTKPLLLEEIRNVLKKIRDLGNESPSAVNESYHIMTSNEYHAITDTLQYLFERVKDSETDIITASSEFEFQSNLQLIRNLQQVHEHKYYTENQLGRLRDKFMAENTLWISNLFGESSKTAVWAHNWHIIKSGDLMGRYIDETLGDNYKTIGFSFGIGSFLAVGVDPSTEEVSGLGLQTIATKPLSNSANALFFGAAEDNFILNLDNLDSNSELGEYFMKENDFISLGSVYNGNPTDYYYPLSLKSEYNVLIHINRSNASTYLQ